jgi:hypothetical protein
VAAEIVSNHDVAGPDGGQQDLGDVSLDVLSVDPPVDHARSLDSVLAQCGKEGQRDAGGRDIGDRMYGTR